MVKGTLNQPSKGPTLLWPGRTLGEGQLRKVVPHPVRLGLGPRLGGAYVRQFLPAA